MLNKCINFRRKQQLLWSLIFISESYCLIPVILSLEYGSRETTRGHMTPCSLSPETMVIRIESRRDAPSLIWTMFLKTVLLLTLTSDIVVVVSADGLNPILSASGAASEAAGDRLPGAAERRDISAYCRRLLAVYGQRYAASVDCLVLAARPVQICQKCFSAYASLNDSYINITSEQVCWGSGLHPPGAAQASSWVS